MAVSKKGVGRVSDETRQLGAHPIQAKDLPEKKQARRINIGNILKESNRPSFF